MKYNDLQELAYSVRRWIESIAGSSLNLDLLSIDPDDLTGGCAIASFELFKRLKNQGVKDVKLCVRPGHCFVMVKNTVIDVTATQFTRGMFPEVFIFDTKNPQNIRWMRYYDGEDLIWGGKCLKFDNTHDALKHFRKYWSKCQQPFELWDPYSLLSLTSQVGVDVKEFI